MKMILTLLAMALITGCATVPKFTPTIETGLKIPEIRRSFMDQLSAKGGVIVNESDHVLVVDLPASGGVNFLKYNVVTGERPKERYRFNFIDLGDKRRVTGFASLVHSPGLAGPVEEDYTDSRTLNAVQNGLENLIAVAEGREPPHESKRSKSVR